ncbi:unnamed protein product [Caenorhabditis auriculariae]|uniref:Phospholipid/glycerol acyltransferase domain-containing protein n=1 Tax=Caenorhabditis auriculariae TaxID=2777116 RepID=A0A8S1GSH4_9PELO|nr:unnamed protein product [Caenorhabditis auriculariae]
MRLRINSPLVALGCGQFALSLMQVMFMFYYVKVYLNVFHVPNVWFNIAQGLFMVWNAINDPIFGYVQDTPGFWLNSRTAVIKFFAPFLVSSFVFMWIPWRTTGSTLEGIHLVLSLFLYDAFFSAIGVAWSALFADSTKDPQLRVSAMKYSQISILLSVNIISITEKLSFSLERFGVFQIITVVVALLALGCLYTAGSLRTTSFPRNRRKTGDTEALMSSRDDSDNEPIIEKKKGTDLSFAWETTKQIVKEKDFLAIIAANFLHNIRSVAHLNFASIATEVVIPQSILAKGSIQLSIFLRNRHSGASASSDFQRELRVQTRRLPRHDPHLDTAFASYFGGLLIDGRPGKVAPLLLINKDHSSEPVFGIARERRISSGAIFPGRSSMGRPRKYPFQSSSILFSCCNLPRDPFLFYVTVHSIAPLFNIVLSDFIDDDASRHSRKTGVSSVVFSLNALFVKPAQSLAPIVIVYVLNFYGYQDYLTSKIASNSLQNAMTVVLFATPFFVGGLQPEMLLTLAVTVDGLKAWVPCSLLSLSMVPYASAALAAGAVSTVLPDRLAQKLDNTLYRGYMRLCLFVFENLSGVQLKLYGDVQGLKEKPEKALVLSNHQTNVDWAVLVMLAARQGVDGNEAGFRVMVKQAIHFVPLFGWYIFQHGYIYVRRFGDFVGEPVLRQLRWLNELEDPYWLLVFPEGTRFTRKKPQLIASSQEFCRRQGRKELEDVLCPRSGGIQMALERLGTLDAVYDVTVAYGQTRFTGRRGLAPGMFEFVCGPLAGRSLHVHVKRFDVKEVPKDKEGLRNWMFERYEQKDKMMATFLEKGEFPEASESPAAVSIWRTLPPTALFCAALAAPFYFSRVKQLYIYTIASSPLLIAWLHLRKCV